MDTYNDFYQRKAIVEDSEQWSQKKRGAATYAAEKVIELMIEDQRRAIITTTSSSDNGRNTTITYESEDSEDSYMKDVCADNSPTANLPYHQDFVEKFFDALRYNLLFNIGFDVDGINPDDERSCFCPCSKSMLKWRKNFGVDYLNDVDKCEGYHKRCIPLGLMSHIRKLGGGDGDGGQAYLHRGIEFYIDKLYGDYWGSIGHKALYQINSAEYKVSVAEENRFKMK